MGRSDPYVINFYLSNLNTEKKYNEVALFGQIADNQFTNHIKCNRKNFFDMQLSNWNINQYPYPSEKKFDLIVCTRCAYFSNNPEKTISEFLSILKDDGLIFIDFGLGDHWRFKDYKVGWIKNKEQEYAYEKNNFLHSVAWSQDFENHPSAIDFTKNINKFGYSNITSAIKREIPKVLNLKEFLTKNNELKISYNLLSLWPEQPQLYILLQISKRKNEN